MDDSDHKSKLVEVEPWGKNIYLYTLKNRDITVRITNWGATIVSICLPDPSTGESVDVVLGFDSCEPYMDGTSPYFGSIVGRVANRIKDATFTVNGESYSLPANNNMNTLHGGEVGYDKVLWDSQVLEDSEAPSVRFTYNSSDGEQGFPGELKVSAIYTLHENELKLEMQAVPGDKATPVSLAQHTYWNLRGHGSGDILGHHLRIGGSSYTPVNEVQIPTGEILPVSGTPFDFREEARVGSRIDQVCGGYDHNYVLDGAEKHGQLHFAARLSDPASGRSLELLTDAPAVQFYSGNFLDGVPGKENSLYGKHAGLCLETQGFPNAINEPKFPSVLVSPGEIYKHNIMFKFQY